MKYCPINQVGEIEARSVCSAGPSTPPHVGSALSAESLKLANARLGRYAPKVGARSAPPPRTLRAAGWLRPAPPCARFARDRSAPRRGRRRSAINRYAHKTGVLYNRMPPLRSFLAVRYEAAGRLRAARGTKRPFCAIARVDAPPASKAAGLGFCPPLSSGLCPPGGSARTASPWQRARCARCRVSPERGDPLSLRQALLKARSAPPRPSIFEGGTGCPADPFCLQGAKKGSLNTHLAR